jgi:hypothetical protein
MPRLAPIGAALFAALAAWVSQGTIGFAASDGLRLAVLPLEGSALLLTLAAAAAVIGLWWIGASLRPLSLLCFVLLPWIPFRAPAAFLIWSGPVVWLIWIGVLLLMLASVPRRRHLAASVAVAAACAVALFSLCAWRAAPMVPGGDEPHYLVITQSLLLDGDLSIEDVHRRGDYRAYYTGDLSPHVQRRGRDGQIYSVHAPGLAVLVAPAFAVAGYPAVVIFLVLLAAAGAALAWHIARTATGREDAAWFGWASVTLPVTAVFQSFTVYPDGPGGVLALTGLWGLLRADRESRDDATRTTPWLLHGAALALLPWLHSRFAVLAGGFGALILLRLSTTKNPAAKAVAFLSFPAASAMLWVGYFMAIYGTPDPSAPYGPGEIGSFRWVPGGLGGLLFDQRFGLVTYAPVLLVAFGGLGVMLARPAWRRLALELLFVVIPYLLTVTHFAMWWGGWSPPARFFAPVLPLFVLPAAVAWTAIERPATRFLASASLALTAIATVVVIGVDRGRLAFNTREAPALWLEWVGRLADLTAAAPMWARDTDVPLMRAIGIWIGVMAVTWMVLRLADGTARMRAPAVLHTISAASIGLAVMLASSIVWAFEGASGRSIVPSQLRLLESMAAPPRAVSVQLDGWKPLTRSDVTGRLRIELGRVPSSRTTGRDIPSMFAVSALPAGEYRLTLTPGSPRGWVMIGIARDQFALRTLQLPVESVTLQFPLPVRGLIVRGDEDARRTVRGLALEPVRILRPEERLTGDPARRAVRYGASTVFFLDDGSYPEPEAFWIGGGRGSTVVVQPDSARPSASLRLRNGPLNNRVTVESGGWRRELDLSPDEEQQVEIPLAPSRGAGLLQIASSASFRPSDHDPASQDRRFLGVWVRVEN